MSFPCIREHLLPICYWFVKNEAQKYPMIIGHDWIAAHIPHKGNMCLLDGVVEWDTTSLAAIASSHLTSDNPLHANGRLGAANGIEYAAQAMAVHSALLINTAVHTGFLASVRNVNLHVQRLDDIGQNMHIHVMRLHGDNRGMLYQFNVQGNSGVQLLDGRAAIMYQEKL